MSRSETIPIVNRRESPCQELLRPTPRRPRKHNLWNKINFRLPDPVTYYVVNLRVINILSWLCAEGGQKKVKWRVKRRNRKKMKAEGEAFAYLRRNSNLQIILIVLAHQTNGREKRIKVRVCFYNGNSLFLGSHLIKPSFKDVIREMGVY